MKRIWVTDSSTSSEKPLARILQLLAHFGKEGKGKGHEDENMDGHR
jgi:hypothetical protein